MEDRTPASQSEDILSGQTAGDKPGFERRSLPARGQLSSARPVALRSPAGHVAEGSIELRQYVAPLIRWWWLILASVVISGVSSYVGTRASPRIYQSRITLMVGQILQNPNPSQSEFYMGQALAQSYADLAKREPVLRATLEALGLKWDWVVLQTMTYSRVVPGTQLLEISVLDNDPQRVGILTQEIAQQLILQSPAATDPEKEAERQFVLQEIENLKSNIGNSREEIRQLDDMIAKSNSARQIQDARDRQTELQAQITTWQATYAQMLTNLQQGTSNFLSVVEPAQIPGWLVGPSLKSNMLMAIAVGLALSCGAAFLLEYLDDTIKTPEDVRKRLGLPTLGRIPPIEGTNYADRLVTAQSSRSIAAGAYRLLRTNIQFSAVDRALCVLVVTSAIPKEGKSLLTANLAITMAQAGQRVILVDADLWHPVQHRIFQRDSRIGLTTVLMNGVDHLAESLQDTSTENLRLLLSGTLPPNPSDLLGSKRMEEIIQALRQQSEIVIFDTPPVTVDADAAILAAHVDGVLLVVNSGSTHRAVVQRSKAVLETVSTRLLGVALNRVAIPAGGYYYYYHDGERRKRRTRRNLLARLFGRDGRRAETVETAPVSAEQTPVSPEQAATPLPTEDKSS